MAWARLVASSKVSGRVLHDRAELLGRDRAIAVLVLRRSAPRRPCSPAHEEREGLLELCAQRQCCGAVERTHRRLALWDATSADSQTGACCGCSSVGSARASNPPRRVSASNLGARRPASAWLLALPKFGPAFYLGVSASSGAARTLASWSAMMDGGQRARAQQAARQELGRDAESGQRRSQNAP